ncbi:DUF1738 domain-containing protein [Muribaculaceae bacterium Isolate-114 (HZI)]|nr:DUF1738 domain-containing protein [Muribaculaceae bacterium Isolate-114 (HZI)]
MKTKEKKTAAQVEQSICEQVTNKLISIMEQGINPWRKPWSYCAEDVAVSHTNGKPYSLLNQILLGFRSGEYLTFNQIKKEGGSVKKGAKSEVVVFWQCGGLKPVKAPEGEEDSQDDEKETQWVAWKNPVLKYYRVFHIDDTEGIKAKYQPKEPELISTINPIENAENTAFNYCNRSGVTLIIQKSNSAFYRPANDSVTVPLREQFSEISEFYSTLFHELTHSTGHPSRLNRLKGGIHKASEKYSREELVAEIGAAACMSKLGIECKETEENSAAYLKSWARFLSSDPKAFIAAAGKAEKAIDMIFGS